MMKNNIRLNCIIMQTIIIQIVLVVLKFCAVRIRYAPLRESLAHNGSHFFMLLDTEVLWGLGTFLDTDAPFQNYNPE